LNFPPFVTKNNFIGIRMGIGPVWGSSSLTPLCSLERGRLKKGRKEEVPRLPEI